MSNRFRIERLGAQGDGVADTRSGPVFIPFALPGETVTAAREKDRAMLMALIEAAPDRVEPVCRHFGECGGCALQHMEASAYRAWKRDKVVHALKGKGVDGSVDDLIACAPASRRRVVLSARKTQAGLLLGYNRALTHTIVDIAECPVTEPELVAALPRLRALAAMICNTAQPFHMTATLTATGIDVAAAGSGKLSNAARLEVSSFAMREKFARLSVDGEIVVEPSKPVVMFGAVAVDPPPGAFLQAVSGVEDTMAQLVAAHFGKAKKIADLFAGAGAFALRLASAGEVHAVEGDAAALAVLDRGFRFASGLKRVTTERRDLFRRPMTARELNAFDAVVFDPPRAGADDQAKQIARSDVPKVAAVSCNPVTLARDLRTLIGGGYTLKSVTPLDQFLWSPHVEAVALLEKPRRRR